MHVNFIKNLNNNKKLLYPFQCLPHYISQDRTHEVKTPFLESAKEAQVM